MAAVVSFGHWLTMFWSPRVTLVSSARGLRPTAGPIIDWFRGFQLYGLTPPVSIAWLSFRGNEFQVPYVTSGSLDDPWHSMLAPGGRPPSVVRRRRRSMARNGSSVSAVNQPPGGSLLATESSLVN